MSVTKTEALDKIREKCEYDARTLRSRAATGEVTDTEIIDSELAVPAFDPKKDYMDCPAGTPVRDEGQVWTLIQPHNAASYVGRPSTLRALWGLCHTRNPKKAKPFAAPYGTSGLYMEGECCLDNGAVYISIVDLNPYSPSEYPQNWTLYTA